MTFYMQLHLSFCQVDDRLVFLDSQADRYFQLRPQLESAFQSSREGRAADASDLSRLAALGLLSSECGHPLSPAQSEPPTASLLELPNRRLRGSLLSTVKATAALIATRRRLSTQSFEANLDRIRRRRTNDYAATAGQAVEVAARFAAVRRRIPIQPICLLDSLALLEFLAMHGAIADLVLGVRTQPFSAHCWVQSGDLVLNEMLDRAVVHTPILVI